MGVMSRRVLPACGSICFFCPSLRARSRQPVKRYKKLLSEIFPRNQEIEANDRKIGKLCEYASKNPLRVPKITEFLEQRFYKDLRNVQLGSAKVVLYTYRKFLTSCKEQMPLFASSLLGVIRTLLEQTQQEEMQILGCNALVDFVNIQVESTYMFNVEGLVPKLCQLAQEIGDDDRALWLRAVGLQALSAMVRFMGEQSHIPAEFDKIISATLENFVDFQTKNGNGKLDRQTSNNACDDGGMNSENNGSSMDLSHVKKQLEPPLDASKSPSYWSKVCLHSMVGLAKEATTIRRVLEPFFHNFDSEDYWSPDTGIACSVLMYMQLLLEESVENSHLLLSILVKHLDHKNVVKQPLKQINIICIIAQLSRYAKKQASVALIVALAELVRHLRKCMQYSAESSSSESGADKLNGDLQSALENCISHLASKIGDVGPVLDMMAVVLENVQNNNIIARTTIFSVYRTAQIVSSLPNISYHKKTFPDALFHQILLTMGHPDNETRIVAHRIFSTVLMPSLICPWSDQKDLTFHNRWRISSFKTSSRVNGGSFSIREQQAEVEDNLRVQNGLMRLDSRSHSFKSTMANDKMEHASLRLSSYQVSLLLSSIWVQAAFTENTPSNYEVMAHTYNTALLFTRSKTSSHDSLIRCFQLAFSLRNISLIKEGGLRPTRRRSLFTLASCMLIFSARAGNLPELIPIVKSSLTDVDPYFELVDDIRLQVVTSNSIDNGKNYGSEEDDIAALKSLSVIASDDQQLKEMVISHVISKFQNLSEDGLSDIKKQLQQGFSPDESYPLAAPSLMEAPPPCSPFAVVGFQPFDEIVAPILGDKPLPDARGSQLGFITSISSNSLDILGANKLLESALATAEEVENMPVSTTHVPYDQVKDQCEALLTGKQQKMSVLHGIKRQHNSQAIVVSSVTQIKSSSITAMILDDLEMSPNPKGKELIRDHDPLYSCSLEFGHQSFRLPPASPYEKFLKAAGC